MAGHVHWNDVNLIDGIPHITIQSLTESFTTEGEAAAAWASVEIDDEIRWRSHGRDPIVLQVPVRSLNAHWRAPLPPFEELARQREIPEGLDDIDGLILDMDGVLYRGPEPIPGAAEAVSALRAAGIGIVALTNNARAAADDYADRLAGMGIDLPAGNIITSGQATARYLKEQAEAPAVFVAGSPALRQEVLAAGATESERPDFVVAGVDLEMPLAALAEAVRHLDAGARLIASNPDRRVPGAQGFEPEAGAVQAFLEAASGQTAVVPGKPNRLIFEMALERLGRRRQAVAVVGDSPDTNIAGANGAGLRSVLLASGNADPGDSPHRPTERLADLAALAERLLA
ncbi:MAG: HAD-IIA family hydrolase [Alphaproteobacteria bacterium]|nr:HAD-IIA family hydrolase [Alphaproteobacteria bacterium]